MVLETYVILQPGQPTRLHFVQHWIEEVSPTDRLTGQPMVKKRLRFLVDEKDGQPVTAYYSTLSQKHAEDFAPFLPGNKYLEYDFIITRTGEGFQTEYRVQPLLRRG